MNIQKTKSLRKSVLFLNRVVEYATQNEQKVEEVAISFSSSSKGVNLEIKNDETNKEAYIEFKPEKTIINWGHEQGSSSGEIKNKKDELNFCKWFFN